MQTLRELPRLLRERRAIQARTTVPAYEIARWLEPSSAPWRASMARMAVWKPSPVPTSRTRSLPDSCSAATNDPRFDPVRTEELSNLRYSVDVLFPPEETVMEDLDPAVFGVIVEDESGVRRGLLLLGHGTVPSG